MTWVDYAVLGVALASIAWGVWRGLVREVISLGAWVIAFLAANLFAGPLSKELPASVPGTEVRVAIAYAAVFIATLILAKLVAVIVSKVVQSVGLGGIDRALGALFGAVRAALVLLAVALVAGLTPLPASAAWKDSVSAPWLAACAEAIRPWLPPSLGERLRYH